MPAGFGQPAGTDWSSTSVAHNSWAPGSMAQQQGSSLPEQQLPAPVLEKRPSDLLHAFAQVTLLFGLPSITGTLTPLPALSLSFKLSSSAHCCAVLTSCAAVLPLRIYLFLFSDSQARLQASISCWWDERGEQARRLRRHLFAAGESAGTCTSQQHAALQAVRNALRGNCAGRQPVPGSAVPPAGAAPRGLCRGRHDPRAPLRPPARPQSAQQWRPRHPVESYWRQRKVPGGCEAQKQDVGGVGDAVNAFRQHVLCS